MSGKKSATVWNVNYFIHVAEKRYNKGNLNALLKCIFVRLTFQSDHEYS